VGARDLERRGVGFAGSSGAADHKSTRALERAFSPEFRNRLNDTVHFNRLTPDVVRKVVDKFLDELDGQLCAQRVTLHVSDEAKEWLGREGYDESFGARPMARLIHEKIKAPLAEELLFGELNGGGEVHVELTDGKLEFRFGPS